MDIVMIWTILLLFAGLLALYLTTSARSRSKNEPPLDKGRIPWLGHALEFRKDPFKFLTRMKKKHGDIFTVRCAGLYVTVLLDPSSYDDVLLDTVSLDFSRYAQMLMQRIFSLNFPGRNAASERDWMEKQFLGHGLAQLNGVMRENVHALLSSPEMLQNQTDWKEEGLFSFCYRLLFRAGYLTLFGKENSGELSTTVYKEFRKFDNLLAKIARLSLKRDEKKRAGELRQRLWDLLSVGPAESWQQSYRGYLRDEGADEETQRRAMLLQLWTTQCNAGPAAFWFLGFLLTNPEAMSAVMSEINSLSPLAETNSASHWRNRRTRLCLTALSVRCYASPLPPTSPESPEMDPEIHQEPEKFKYDRFLKADGTAKTDFFKCGRRLKYYTMPWGAGKNICVGRHFAVSGIKEFIFMVLTCLDLELCDPDSAMPPVNTSRYGFGMLQPDGDLEIRYRLKRSSPT
ncbi:hypothetical protein AAFF_G00232670 [Aldrovandia affinis]|uniref:Prostacyclin synthase n=1 Tax=Aldrovandia affinis TaxID=143900 RepID=A0AAD7RF47_9TELE|nr:hypothetical protein AAFF_G00232670 [Aldrovandia affinis]